MQYLTYTDPDTGLLVREGARDGKFVTDVELTVTGFNGTENIDWENIDNITPQ
jgi:hypothetical protein